MSTWVEREHEEQQSPPIRAYSALYGPLYQKQRQKRITPHSTIHAYSANHGELGHSEEFFLEEKEDGIHR